MVIEGGSCSSGSPIMTEECDSEIAEIGVSQNSPQEEEQEVKYAPRHSSIGSADFRIREGYVGACSPRVCGPHVDPLTFPAEGFDSQSSAADDAPLHGNTSPWHSNRTDQLNNSGSMIKPLDQIVDLTKYQSSFRKRYMQWRKFYHRWRSKSRDAEDLQKASAG